jgi:carboxymethylenebutenolidase
VIFAHHTQVDLPTADGILDCHVFLPGGRDGEASWPGVILYMDAFGIREHLLAMAARLAANGFVVALPNLYYRTGPLHPFDAGEIAAGGPERDRFKQMIGSIDGTMVARDTAAVLARFDRVKEVRPGPVGAVGYCMGGGYALGAAGHFPERIAVAASFHGGSLATDKPDSPHLLADRMKARLYIGVAETDASFSPEQRARLEAALTAAGVPYTVEVYPGTKHGFAVTGHLVYDQMASERHWVTVIDLLRATL